MEVSAMTPGKRIMRSGRVFLLFSVSAIALLGQPSVAVAQSLGSCLAAAVPANVAIARLKEFTITSDDVLDLADVQGAIDDAVEGLADNVRGEGDEPSKLAELCERLDTNELGVVIAEDDCTADSDGATCDGAEIFSNYQDVIEGLGEDAVPQITNADKIADLRIILADIYNAIRFLVDFTIAKALEPGTLSSGSDSPAIDDALREQATAETQATNCLAGTGELRACGDGAASFFDAWFNAIIEIIE
jgi:hypothetical protein